MPDMWRDALLRQLAEPAREQTCARNLASRHRFRTAGRALVVLLSRRRVFRILAAAAWSKQQREMSMIPDFRVRYAVR